jgi:DNA-directed RNA polymerase specialized sigma24 family protein
MSVQQAWQLCVSRRERLLRAAARLGMAEQADDIVHDVFIAVVKLPILFREGFESLLDTVLWRRCAAVRRRETHQAWACRNAALMARDHPDHSDGVLERVYAESVLNSCSVLDDKQLWLLQLVSDGCSQERIAALAEISTNVVNYRLRRARRLAREHLAKVGSL